MATIIKFTPQQIKAYWDTSQFAPVYINNRYNMEEVEMMFPHKYDNLHCFYLRTIMIAEEMRVHADGFYPYKLIAERRPNEPPEVETYRLRIYSAKTKAVVGKVFSSLGKIRRSADWIISYPKNQDDFPLIVPEESLEEYTEKNLPYFTSVTDWVFNILLRKYLIDPNSLVFVDLMDEAVAENKYVKPYPIIYDAINVLDYVENQYAVLLDPYGALYYENGIQNVGRKMTIITAVSTSTYYQANIKGDWKENIFNHNLGFLPAFKTGGTIIEQSNNKFLFESRVAPMIPELNEAARENSDLQAVKVLHQFPERYEWTNRDCAQCQGNGRIANPLWDATCNFPDSYPCDACHGQGVVASGPFSGIVMKLPDATNPAQNFTGPPIGYVQKDTKIIEIQELSVKAHINDALSAINFDFLADVPLTTSGVSKQYDRNESNNTTHAIAEDLVAIMDKVYKTIAYYRYTANYKTEEVDQMLPVIPVPENYDLYSVADAQAALNNAKSGKINPVIINAMEKDYSNKVFSADPSVRDRVNLILDLDPLPNITEDEKMSRLSNKGITQIAYVISSNIQEFVQQALEDNPKFADDDLSDQKAVMEKMAQAVIDENSATAKVIKMVPGGNGLTNADGTPVIPAVTSIPGDTATPIKTDQQTLVGKL